jgi:hypothetical protein
MYALVFSQMANRPLPDEVPAAWRERWAGTGREPLPLAFTDDPAHFPPPPQSADIARRNAQTVERARQAVLPLIQGPRS